MSHSVSSNSHNLFFAYRDSLNKLHRKPQSRMDNPQTLATLETQERGRTLIQKTQHRKLNDKQHGPCGQSGGKASCARMVSSSWFL